jgi:hypothetical protein
MWNDIEFMYRNAPLGLCVEICIVICSLQAWAEPWVALRCRWRKTRQTYQVVFFATGFETGHCEGGHFNCDPLQWNGRVLLRGLVVLPSQFILNPRANVIRKLVNRNSEVVCQKGALLVTVLAHARWTVCEFSTPTPSLSGPISVPGAAAAPLCFGSEIQMVQIPQSIKGPLTFANRYPVGVQIDKQ